MLRISVLRSIFFDNYLAEQKNHQKALNGLLLI